MHGPFLIWPVAGVFVSMDAHIYIHIPFCLSKCRYCAFSSVVSKDIPEERYISALLKEAALCRERGIFSSGLIETLYIGGGTPTLVTPSNIKRLIDGLRGIWSFSESAEVSIEANPETLDADYVIELKKAGITRVSMGVQTFSSRLLSYLGRIHTPERSIQSFRYLRESGFDNINVDLIFGIPIEKQEELDADLDWIEMLEPEHVSAYLLEHEPGTWFADIAPCDEDSVIGFFSKIEDRLRGMGFIHYEISNYARPGFKCRHNLAYWKYRPYLGLGASAVSCVREGTRWRNIKDPYEYMVRIEKNISPVEYVDNFSADEILFEKRFLSLRTAQGIDIHDMPKNVPPSLFNIKGSRVVLTKEGMLVSDEIFSML